MTANDTQSLLTSALSDFGMSAFVVLSAVVAVLVGFLVLRLGMGYLRSFGSSDNLTLEFMHSAEGTKRFKALGPKDQEAWSKRDRELSRAQILAMDK